MSGIDRAYYKLNIAPTANYDTSGSISGQPPGNVTANVEGGQDLIMWLVDGRGNVNYDHYSVVEMRYDITPPTNAQAESPDTSASEIFTVEWHGADDNGGSGLSGTYDVKYKEGSGAWFDWKVNFKGISADFTGENGKTYYFEAAARDSAGNMEIFSGIPESFTLVDTTIIDILAPAAPINLIAGGSSPSPWQNTNSFELNWTNPSDISGIVRAYYKLNSAPTSNYDTTGSLSGQPPENVTAGIQGGQILYLWLRDGKDNIDFQNNSSVILNFDLTNPTGSIASSIETAISTTFAVSWTGGTDTGGSGLSGHYDVNVKDGADNWTSWKQNFSGTSDNYTGVNGHTYYFEAAARDIAGNIEIFVGIPECSTAVDTTNDIIAPLAPNNIAVSPSDWTNTNNFNVSWTNPEPDANIEGAWYKLGSAPLNDDDGIYILNAVTQLSNIKTTISGYHDINVWLQDKSVNHSYLNSATGVIRFDSIAPGINPNLATSYSEGAAIIVNPVLSDAHSGINNANLYYRKTGATNVIGPVAFVNDTATIPLDYSTQQGLEYAIEATDNANNVAREPISGYNSIQILLSSEGGTLLDNSGQPVAQTYGSTANSYRIFSVPFILNNKTPAAVLEDDLGAYDNTKWKFFNVNNTTLNEYPGIKNSSIITPGKGFLLIINMADKVIDSGPGVTPKISDYKQISLSDGWNLIGNPFDIDIPLNNLSLNGSIPQAWYLDNNGWSSNPPYLYKWGGIAINSTGPSTLYINAVTGNAYDYSISDGFFDDNWGIRVKATGEHSSDFDNFIGVYSDDNEIENTIWCEPPNFSGAISLRILPGELDNQLEKNFISADDKLSTLIQPKKEDGNLWDFEIIGDKAGEKIKIDLEYFQNIPENFEKYLVDLTLKTVYDLSDNENIIECKTNSYGKSIFRILIGTQDYIESNSEGIAIVPLTFELRQNFPNPFNPGTSMIFGLPKDNNVTLEVYSILGQKVRTLVDNQKYKKGYHTIDWNGMNDFGNQVSSGMYIFRLISKNQVSIKKGILIR